MQKILLILPILFLSCNRNDPWKHSTITSSSQEYDLAKLTYPAESPQKGIEIELVRQGKNFNGYLNVGLYEIPPHESDPHKAMVHLRTDEDQFSLLVDRLEGGQRLHLTDECLDLILYLLHHHPKLSIRLGHFAQTFEAKKFNQHYDKLLKYTPRFRPENFVTFELY